MTAIYILFFFNDTATTEIYTLSLHDALPIFAHVGAVPVRRDLLLGGLSFHTREVVDVATGVVGRHQAVGDRKSTRLNSSHANISYAVFCLKKKQIIIIYIH